MNQFDLSHGLSVSSSMVLDRIPQSEQQTENRPAIAIHAIALSASHAERVLEVSKISGFGYRQYASVNSLLESAAPSAIGCVVFSGGDHPARYLSIVNQLKSYFMTMPIVVLLDAESNTNTVSLMQLGVFSVLTGSVEHVNLLRTINDAVETSVEGHSSVAHGRDASLRMREATAKELEVLELMMQGKKNKEISAALGITVRAVEDRRFRLMKKVSADSVAELVTTAVSARYYDQGFGTSPSSLPVIPTMRKCLKGIEVWKPSRDESCLELHESCYLEASAFQDASRSITFRAGEGMPGKIWQQRSPAFLKELITTEFVRSGIASAAGMTTAIGFPVFCEGRVECVVLILLDSRDQVKAAFESWKYDTALSALKLVGGTYINCEKLRRLSEFLSLPIGQGLAGIAVEQNSPYIGARFSENSHAVRGIALSSEQLLSGVALPLTDSGLSVSDVFLLFNSETTPLFSVLQVWKPISESSELFMIAEFIDGVPTLSSQVLDVAKSPDKGIAGEAFASRMPVVLNENTNSTVVLANQFASQSSMAIAIPTIIAGKLVAVTVLGN